MVSWHKVLRKSAIVEILTESTQLAHVGTKTAWHNDKIFTMKIFFLRICNFFVFWRSMEFFWIITWKRLLPFSPEWKIKIWNWVYPFKTKLIFWSRLNLIDITASFKCLMLCYVEQLPASFDRLFLVVLLWVLWCCFTENKCLLMPETTLWAKRESQNSVAMDYETKTVWSWREATELRGGDPFLLSCR